MTCIQLRYFVASAAKDTPLNSPPLAVSVIAGALTPSVVDAHPPAADNQMVLRGRVAIPVPPLAVLTGKYALIPATRASYHALLRLDPIPVDGVVSFVNESSHAIM
jgi:hypothetical protein